MVSRLVACLVTLCAAILLVSGTPAAAQETSGEYRAAIDSMYLEVRAMWGELDRFKVEKRYCRPPPPSKAEAEAELAALEQRAKDLNSRYQALKQSLLSFLDHNHRLYSEMMVDNRDPRDRRWWTRDDNNLKRMNDELARKKAALAAAPEVNCGQTTPTQRPAVTAGPATQPQQQAQPSLPQRPAYAPLNWPPMPAHFCSLEEYWNFINQQINPLYLKAAENAEAAAKFRADVERAINALVQADKPVPQSLRALARQAQADVTEQNRLSQESEEIRRRAKAIPIIDCRQPRQEPPRQDMRTGQATPAQPPKEPDWAKGLDQWDGFMVGMQQRVMDDVEADLKDLEDMARRRGSCGALFDFADDIDYGLDELADSKKFPPEMIREWRARLDDIMDGCPPLRINLQDLLRKPVTGLPPPTDPNAIRILDVHNKERARFGAQPLQWSPALQATATAYANELARTGVRVHATREGRGIERENLSQGLLGWGIGQHLGSWTREAQKFTPGIFPNVCAGDWSVCGHYTQMIWPTTLEIGCGLAKGSGFSWFVCRYSPGGNKDGQPVGLPSNAPVIAQDSGIAPPNSSTTTGLPFDPRSIPKLPVGGGMTQIDPPPPPPPTARDDAPEGDEARHPLVRYAQEADAAHARETDCGNPTMARLELEKMRYALDELKKRLKAARQAGPFSGVKPADVQRQIDDLERRIREAEQRKPRPRPICPPPPPPPPVP